MKKLLNIFVLILTFVMLCPCGMASNENTDTISVVIDGEKINFEQDPIILDGRTMVPMRKIFETFDADVEWDGENRIVTATKGILNIKFIIGYPVYIINDILMYIDSAPVILNGSTLIPARVVASCFGCDVEWDDNTKTVNIHSKKMETMTDFSLEDYISYYYGETVNGKPYGYGIMEIKNKDGVVIKTSIGTFKDTYFEGVTKSLSDNNLYKIEYPYGYIYTGDIKNYASHYGTAYYAGGGRYTGNFKYGLFSGQGTFYWVDGDRCEGNWKNGNLDGQGTFYWADGDRYEGNWKDSSPDGQGTFYWADGDRYEGNWKNGSPNGWGTYYHADGRSCEGNWTDGKSSNCDMSIHCERVE